MQAEGWGGLDNRHPWEIEEANRKAQRERERDEEVARLRREVERLKRKKSKKEQK